MMDVIQAYMEPHRYYHTFEHISKMIINAEHYNLILTDAEMLTLRMAILYHDYVYDPTSDTNEADSVDVFMDRIMNGRIDFDKSVISMKDLQAQVMIMILDTKKHKPTFKLSEYLIDLDLWDLAFKDAYKNNAKSIRKEYSMYSQEEYVIGRIEWIQSMLNRDTIYYTSLAQNVGYNDLARKNLQNELNLLSVWELH